MTYVNTNRIISRIKTWLSRKTQTIHFAMADGEEYYVEETAEYAEETAEYAEETGEDAPAGEVDVVGRLLCKHHDNLTARQYYVSFGTLCISWSIV